MPNETAATTTPVGSLPPSCACVYKTLEHEGPLCRSEVVDRSYLPERTVGDALAQLREAGVVTAESPIHDLRRTEYRLDET